MQACVFKHTVTLRVAKSFAEVWVMMRTHKLHCYQLAQLVWSILTILTCINHKCCIWERVHVFCGNSKSLSLYVDRLSFWYTRTFRVWKMRDFHYGLTGNIGALVKANRVMERLAGDKTKTCFCEWKGISAGGIHAGFYRNSFFFPTRMLLV